VGYGTRSTAVRVKTGAARETLQAIIEKESRGKPLRHRHGQRGGFEHVFEAPQIRRHAPALRAFRKMTPGFRVGAGRHGKQILLELLASHM
jgi:hypothetical protein